MNPTRLFVVLIAVWGLSAAPVRSAPLTINRTVSEDFTAAEVDVIDAALLLWSTRLNAPEPRTIDLNFTKTFTFEFLGATSNIQFDPIGNPVSADIEISDFWDFFVDPTPFDDSEFQTTANPLLLTADPAGPAQGREDLFSVVAHEVGHALGWARGLDRFESRVFTLSEVDFFVGEVLAVPLAGDGSGHPDDLFDPLMGVPGFQSSQRALIGQLSTAVLDDAFDYNNTAIHRLDSQPVPLTDANFEGNGVTLIPIDVDQQGVVQDLDVALFIEHTFISDLALALISPQGTRVDLSFHQGGLGEDYGVPELWTRFDDESVAFFIDGQVSPFPGTFAPEEFLSDFDGEDMFGQWVLEVTDDQPFDAGVLNELALIFSLSPPGDTNNDGRIDAVDLNTLAINWQMTVANGPADADFNFDGFVDAADLNLIALGWQFGVAQEALEATLSPAALAAIPEPAAATLMAVLTLSGIGVRFRRR